MDIKRKYANLAVTVGANVQPGQRLFLQADVESADFVRLCVEEAYKVGAKEVIVQWNDQYLGRLEYEYMTLEDLQEVKPYSLDKLQYLMDERVARLNVHVPNPGLLEGIDPDKIQKTAMAQSAPEIRKKFRQYSMNNTTQWSLISIPSKAWAKKVFPDLSEEEGIDAMWSAILSAVRVNEETDHVSNWEQHNKTLHAHNKKLNDFNFKSIHFKNSKGTDLVVGLVPNHIWSGGQETALNGVVFNPNMPTEETFTMPDRNHVDGVVYSTMPLNYGGVLIDEFWLKFENGKVVDFDAKDNKEMLGRLLDFDEGSRHIGEIALISHDSPISNTGILFYNTLFDENASCHMALGAAYPMNIKGGSSMSQEELKENGANTSTQHVDFMFGSSDMSIMGLTQDDQEVVVFENGNFVF